MRVNSQLFEPLVAEDLTQPASIARVPRLVPCLATSWTSSPDRKMYTFVLRKGVKFHDGTDFNADSVVFAVRRMTDKSFKYYDPSAAGRSMRTWLYLQSVRAVDPYKVEFRLKHPFTDFVRLLSEINGLQVISPAAVEKYGNDGFADHPAGTGPFRFDSRVRGQSITLVRNEQYWGKKPNLDKVVFRPLSDPATRVLALENHEVDMIAVPPPDTVARLKTQGFVVETGLPPHVWYLCFNFANKTMRSREVREAINYAINREAIATELLKGMARPAYSIQSPANVAFDPNEKSYRYDPKKARMLLAKAGYPNGFETALMTSVDGSGQLLPVPMAEWIQRDLAVVGIKVKLETQEWISYLRNYSNGMPPDVGMNQMSSGRTTPFFLEMISDSKFKAPGGFNSGQYVNPKLDALMDEASAMPAERTAIDKWRAAEKLVMDDAAFAPIVNDEAPYAVSKNVHGFTVPAQEWYDLTKVWISK
jgi:peptide/nickel transport system substrate-binding protein